MLKRTISFEDFDGNPATETLYFNLTKTELAQNLDMKDRLDGLASELRGLDQEAEMSVENVQKMLDMLKWLMKLSYGIRSEDGKRFSKKSEHWEAFEESAAYDAFIFQMFQNPDRLVQFMYDIIPNDIRNQVVSEAQNQTGMEFPLPAQPQEVTPTPAPEPQASQPIVSHAEPETPMDMTPEERAAFQEYLNNRNANKEQ